MQFLVQTKRNVQATMSLPHGVPLTLHRTPSEHGAKLTAAAAALTANQKVSDQKSLHAPLNYIKKLEQ